MTKFWMVTLTILALGSMTGCPNGDDDCSIGACDVCGNDFCGRAEGLSGSCPEDCGDGFCGDGFCDSGYMAYEDCTACPEDCTTGCDDAGADGDADSDTTEDDGDTSEDTACPTCPDVTGDWIILFRNEVTGDTPIPFVLTLEQNGTLVTGMDEYECEYTGTISASGYISLFRDCYTYDRTVTGNFTSPPHMTGDWYNMTTADRGTWTADPQ